MLKKVEAREDYSSRNATTASDPCQRWRARRANANARSLGALPRVRAHADRRSCLFVAGREAIRRSVDEFYGLRPR